MTLTQSILKEELIYDPESGVFIRCRTRRKVKAGDIAGTINLLGYVQIRVGGKLYFGHRLAWLYMTGSWPPNEIDHIDGNPGNNRWGNLRAATHSQNMANARRRKDNKTGVKGVRPFRGKYQSSLGYRNRIHLGTFHTIEEAAAAYRNASEKEYGSFSRTDDAP